MSAPDRAVAEALAYEVWHYLPPNEGAIATAVSQIARVQEAAEAAGYRLVFERAASESSREGGTACR